ncbi:MAG: hypothetical protein LC118_17445 [Dehalococcoidia bacterium]|nr:hypothetical protein [Dehalococcoidia bacterium]
MDLPIHIGEDGARLQPTGKNPYELPWVQGAAETVPLRTRRQYATQLADLREKLEVLKTKRPAQTMRAATPDGVDPAWGPRRRPAALRVQDQQPLPADGQPIWS